MEIGQKRMEGAVPDADWYCYSGCSAFGADGRNGTGKSRYGFFEKELFLTGKENGPYTGRTLTAGSPETEVVERRKPSGTAVPGSVVALTFDRPALLKSIQNSF